MNRSWRIISAEIGREGGYIEALKLQKETRPITTSRQLAVACARIADDKKATQIVVLDLRKLNSITDYFVICSASNERQSRAIADEVTYQMKHSGHRCYGIEGDRTGPWILEDYGDFVLHVFRESLRQHYDIESLWADAPIVKWEKAVRKSVAKKRKKAVGE